MQASSQEYDVVAGEGMAVRSWLTVGSKGSPCGGCIQHVDLVKANLLFAP